MSQQIQTINILVSPGQEKPFFRICMQQTICENVRALFRFKFHDSPPEDPIHLVAYYDSKDSITLPLCYIHFYEWQGCLLCGGACVDQRVLKKMNPDERASMRNAGGAYYLSLSTAFNYFQDKTLGVFGYCGDPLSERISLRAGFQKTPFKYVIAWWSSTMQNTEKLALIEKVRELGPF